MPAPPDDVKKDWQAFWNGYRATEAHSDADLFVQVGKTIEKRPIPKVMFDRMIASIAHKLALSPHDELLDLCCGNGLVSRELAPLVRHVTAVDFAEHLINAARKHKASDNITYRVANADAGLDVLMAGAAKPTKLLMNDALAYFEPRTLKRLLANVIKHVGDDDFTFLLTGIPNEALKWNFYDTPERRMRHASNESEAGNTNEGLGRWWSAGEIETVCSALGLSTALCDQPGQVSNYRMDALIRRR